MSEPTASRAFQLYGDDTHQATPWPYGDWAAFCAAPPALVDWRDDITRWPPGDGVQEQPAVPAHLPRPLPLGRYRAAVHHDEQYLYVLLEVIDAPVVPQVGERPEWIGALTVISSDLRYRYLFRQQHDGTSTATRDTYPCSPRAPKSEPRPLRADQTAIALSAGKLLAWRVPRAELAEAFDGAALLLSISYLRYHTMEAAGWGSFFNWAPRDDEMMRVRLVSQRTPAPWATVARVLWHYDEDDQRSRFVVQWRDLYNADEPFPALRHFDKWGQDWQHFNLRVNGELFVLPMEPSVTSPWVKLDEGVNTLEVAAAAGPVLRLYPEQRSASRLLPPRVQLRPLADRQFVTRQLQHECQQAIAARRERRARGEELIYRMWSSHIVASLGRVHHYLLPNAELLEVVRDQADLTLRLQREDGTFSGVHLMPNGIGKTPWQGGSYDTGPAGDLLVVAAKVLGEDQYLQASERLVRAYQTYRIEFNYNYAAFAIWHLASHYRATRLPLALEHALYYATQIVTADLLPLGAHGGHNYYNGYASLILDTLSDLIFTLPTDHPQRAGLLRYARQIGNRLLTHLQADGQYDARERNKPGLRIWLPGVCALAPLVSVEEVKLIDAVVDHMLQIPAQLWGRSFWERCAYNSLVRYLALRERLLAGEPVDGMTVL